MPIDLKELIIENRSIRTFDESVRFDRETLASFVDCARLSASARNAQTLKFRLVLEKDETEALLALTRWAGDITDRKLPPDGGHPTAFIVICHDKNVSESMNDFSAMDVGIAAQSVTLAAAEAGYGACMIGSFSPRKVRIASRSFGERASSPADRARQKGGDRNPLRGAVRKHEVFPQQRECSFRAEAQP